jgi:hypothetical protein
MSYSRRKVYKANDGRCNTKKRRSSANLPPVKPTIARFLWQDSGITFAFVSNARVGVDFDVQLIHNTGSRGSGENKTMRAFKRLRIAVPLISIVASFALSAQAEEPNRPREGQGRPAAPHTGQVRGPQGPHVAHGNFPARNFGGHAYHGRLAWEGGRWRHEMHNGRYGYWWDVGGVWYFYPQPMDGPPTYVSDVEAMDDAGGPDDGMPAGPGPGYPPPAAAYAPPPPPPPAPDPAASAVGGAIVGGVLGGLITGRPVGAAVGAIAGGTAGAIAGAQAAQRPGYYLAQGNCYYKYPSGQYVQVDPRSCY